MLKKSFKSLKASLEVRKLSFLLDSNNSNSVWEWKKPLTPKVFSWIDRAQGFFFFFSKYYIAYLLFILSFKNCLNRNGTKNESWEFWNHSDMVDGYLLRRIANLLLCMLGQRYSFYSCLENNRLFICFCWRLFALKLHARTTAPASRGLQENDIDVYVRLDSPATIVKKVTLA